MQAIDAPSMGFAVVTLYDSTGTWVFSTKNVKERLLQGILDIVGDILKESRFTEIRSFAWNRA